MLSTNTRTHWTAKTVSADEFKAVCESAPFLSEKRLVIVRGLLDRFGAKAPSSRQAKTRKRSSSKLPPTKFSATVSLNSRPAPNWY